MRNEEIFAKSNEYMPGGVNSPVRAYRDMGIDPPVMKCGKGVIIKDEDGKEYIDFVLAWGPMILGHCNDEVVTAIKEISEITGSKVDAIKKQLSRGRDKIKEVIDI